MGVAGREPEPSADAHGTCVALLESAGLTRGAAGGWWRLRPVCGFLAAIAWLSRRSPLWPGRARSPALSRLRVAARRDARAAALASRAVAGRLRPADRVGARRDVACPTRSRASRLGAGTAAPAVRRFARDVAASGHFDSSAQSLKVALSDPVGDRIVETLRMARQVGGTELTPVLRALAASVRADAALRAEVESRQSWIRGAAVLGVAAPWVILALLRDATRGLTAYSSPRASRSSSPARRCRSSPTASCSASGRLPSRGGGSGEPARVTDIALAVVLGRRFGWACASLVARPAVGCAVAGAPDRAVHPRCDRSARGHAALDRRARASPHCGRRRRGASRTRRRVRSLDRRLHQAGGRWMPPPSAAGSSPGRSRASRSAAPASSCWCCSDAHQARRAACRRWPA
jgi:tight adherence protein B